MAKAMCVLSAVVTALLGGQPARAQGVSTQEATASTAQATAPPAIRHTPLRCVKVKEHPRVKAGVTAEAEIQRNRVYFKAHQHPDWYYIDMRATKIPDYLALLPQPLPETRLVDYYVDALDVRLQASRTDEYAPEVTRGSCCLEVALPDDFDRGIVLHGTKDGQSPIPPGFSAAGVVAFIAVSGVKVAGAGLTGSAVATSATAATGAAAAGTAASGAAAGGISATTIAIVGGVAAVGAAGTAVALSRSGDEAPPPTLTGRWVGTLVENDPFLDCVDTYELIMNLTESGGSVTGTMDLIGVSTTRPGVCAGAGTTFDNWSATQGTLGGNDLRLPFTRMFGTFPNTWILSGTASTDRSSMNGTWEAAPTSGGLHGTWTANRQ